MTYHFDGTTENVLYFSLDYTDKNGTDTLRTELDLYGIAEENGCNIKDLTENEIHNAIDKKLMKLTEQFPFEIQEHYKAIRGYKTTYKKACSAAKKSMDNIINRTSI